MEDTQSLQKLYLLGTPRLERDGLTVSISRRKSLALLAYLAVSAQPQARDSLLAFLWPDYNSADARQNLRRDLATLRETVGKELIPGDRKQLRFSHDEDMWVDVLAFLGLLATVAAHQHETDALCPDCIERLAEAEALYSNDFMAGFGLNDAPAFDDWQYYQASALRHELSSVLKRLLAALKALGRYEDALPHARRWLALDPLHEPAQRELLRLLAWSGQTAAAMEQFAACKKLLDDELGVAPETKTLELVAAIRERRLDVPAVEKKIEDRPVPPTRPAAPAPAPTPIPHNLSIQPTPFIGREQELADLAALLADPDIRLITVVAPGGMGKTRLALAAAEGQLTSGRYPNGIFFVSLAPLSDPDNIPAAMAEAFDLPLETEGSQRRTPKQQVLDYLSDKQLLLLLDNFEHLLAGATLVNDILAAAPKVQIAATSRERLGLRAEQIYAIQGLQFPNEETTKDAAKYSASRLFLQSARQIQAGFDLEGDELSYLSRICQLVDGMPLAVELAAGWVDTLSLADIAEEIQRNLDFLATDVRDIAERQRSIRAVFDATWRRLTTDEQSILAQIAVFRGGFTREAAQKVTGASLRILSNLTNKSLLTYNRAQNRYQVHELLRQYADGQLAIAEVTIAEVRSRHCSYYLNMLATIEDELKGRGQQKAIYTIEAELSNILLAWEWAVLSPDRESLLQGLEAVGLFYECQGRFEDGQIAFDRILDSLNDPISDVALHILANAYGWAGFFHRFTSGYDIAVGLLQNGLKKLQEVVAYPAPSRIRGILLMRLGQCELSQHYDSSLEAFTASVDIFRQLGLNWELAWSLKGQGEAAWGKGVFELATTALEEALQLFRSLGDQRGIAATALIASSNARYSGFEKAALDLAQECLTASQKVDSLGQYAAALNNLSNTLLFMFGRYEEALALQLESTEIVSALGNPLQQSQAFFGLAFRYQSLGKLDEARENFELAIDWAQKTGQNPMLLNATGSLGLMLALAGDFQQGLPMITEAQHLAANIGGENMVAVTAMWRLMAEILHKPARSQRWQALATLKRGWQTKSFFAADTAIMAIRALLLREPLSADLETRSHLLALEIDAMHKKGNAGNQWDMAVLEGGRLQEVISRLPPNIVEQTQAHGRSRQWWEMVIYLIDILTEMGWNDDEFIDQDLHIGI